MVVQMNTLDILYQFGIENIVSVSEISSGHINKTFIVECMDNKKLVLQSLNKKIFQNSDLVMKNLTAIERQYEASDCHDIIIPHYLYAGENNYFVKDGELFRLYTYFQELESCSGKHYKLGNAFGSYIKMLNSKNIHLENTIENFHNFSSYFTMLAAADSSSMLKKIDKSVMIRLGTLKETLSQVFTVDFPKRNVHNDAKLDNVIFGEKCMIIDLDTTMLGYAAIDFGDMIRSSCSFGELDFTVIRDITKGFANGTGGILNDDEIYSLYYGILYVTGELAVRYLIDYLSVEKYFKEKSSAACLSRANELLVQLNSFITHGDDIISIIYKEFKKQ